MAPPWKPQNGYHSGLEISHRPRDSHISTADHRQVNGQDTTEDWTATTDSGTLSARSDEGTPGGKVLKNRGPYLLQTDSRRSNDLASRNAPRCDSVYVGISRQSCPHL